MEAILNFLKDPGVRETLAQVVTQALAFLIFLWILKKFAWKPVLHLLESRREKISSEFERIDSLETEVNALKGDYEDKIKDIEAEARTRVQDAVNEGRRIADEIAEKARQDARQIVAKAKQKVEIELAKARVELKEDVINLTLNATEKFLKEKMDEEKNRDLISSFIDEMEKK